MIQKKKWKTVQKLLKQLLYLQNWRKNTLDKYIVKISPQAIKELKGIYEYIASEKLAPQNAKEAGWSIIT